MQQCLQTTALPTPEPVAWMPDWHGQTAVVVASGPSANKVELTEGAGLARFIVVNNSWRLCPWADILYACDFAWWLKARGMPDWPGLKVSQDKSACDVFPDIKRVWSRKGTSTPLVLGDRSSIAWAGNSGTQALNLAVNLGAAKIILVGYDMTLDHGIHWHAKHATGLSNPRPLTVENWRRRTDAAADELERLGIKVINCSPFSALQRYPKMTFEEALFA